MNYGAQYQQEGNDQATVYGLCMVKCSDGIHQRWRRELIAIGSGLEVRGKLNQIFGIMAGVLLEKVYNSRFDITVDVAADSMNLLMLASRKAYAMDPGLNDRLSLANQNAGVGLAFKRGPQKAVHALMDLCDLTRHSSTRVDDKGEWFKSLRLEFDRSCAKAKTKGFDIDNEEELRSLLVAVESSASVMLIDAITP